MLLACKEISVAYDGHLAVDKVSFDVVEGDYLCIVGENGSGKSTLIKGILGLVRPLKGSITFNGLSKLEIGYLPQQTMVQHDFPASVWEVVLSGCLNQRGLLPHYSAKEKNRASVNIERLGIGGIKHKSYRDLSCGQQQRVLLARALCSTEKLLLLDEPVAGLDPLMTLEFYSLIAALNKDRGTTVIMVSHDIRSAIRYGNKILHLGIGTAFFGTVQEYQKTDFCRRMIGELANA